LVQDIEKQKEPIILSEIIIIEESPLAEKTQIEETKVEIKENPYKNCDIEIIWKT
jgi:hypothetical protein